MFQKLEYNRTPEKESMLGNHNVSLLTCWLSGSITLERIKSYLSFDLGLKSEALFK